MQIPAFHSRLLSPQTLPAEHAAVLTREVASGVFQLHQQGVVHRDIRAANVLLVSDSPLKAKLADFGFSVKIPKDVDELNDGSLVSYLHTTLKQPIGTFCISTVCFPLFLLNYVVF